MARDSAAAHRRPPNAVVAGCIVVAVCYAWVAGHFTTFTRPAEVATFVPGLVGVIVAFRIAPPSRLRPNRSRRAWLAWWLVVVGLNVVEFVALVLGANHAHPTLSDLVNPWLLSTPSRALAFALWLGFGYWLTRR